MSTKTIHQKLPTEWSEREKLREKGQFWTPDWVAQAMVAYVAKGASLVFDPAVGKGAFYSALSKISHLLNNPARFYGTDIDERIVADAQQESLFDQNNCTIELRDFILSPPDQKFEAIVANPPYIRHHRLSPRLKSKLRQMSLKILGDTIDGRAGIHIYFLIQALNLLQRGGRLAFILPADTFEGVFSLKLWKWVSKKFRIECVITFASDATPFPNVDTNAVVVLIKNVEPAATFLWVKATQPYTNDLLSFVSSSFHSRDFPSLHIVERSIVEGISTGLSRDPNVGYRSDYKLYHFARVIRGIATGANEFFFLTRSKADQLGIPSKFLKRAIGRTRDVNGSAFTPEHLQALEQEGRPTLLLSINGPTLDSLPPSVQTYLKHGEQLGLPRKALIATRSPWYKMEHRNVPDFLFAYLGRRNARFIKNEAAIIPLTGFLCIYSLSKDPAYLEKLWLVLQHPDTIKNLFLVGKSYGSGAIKVEPKSLSNLPIPNHVLEAVQILPPTNEGTELDLFENHG